MATVVSHAMRRIATTPDANYSSCGIRSEKSRLSWNQDSSESALSRSMRYADPWLYDGVRGGSGLLLAPALVLCSCQDYLNGTKRSSKNKKGPSTCKKCKGTRLPLSNGDTKFGTVRCYPTPTLTQTPIRAGTVRVTSSSRPSILPTADPYDLMRRSRLTVGDNGGSQFRARSVSPKKVRTNESRSSSASRHKPTQITKYSTVGRRSILECNVNPYELMSIDANGVKDSAITLLNGQRIRVRPQITDYDDVKGKPAKTRPSSTSSSTSSSPKTDADSGRFKSILKKPSTSFSDTEYEASTPSPLQHRSGSHFYLPMPSSVNGPRKKVQFLVESERVSFECNGNAPAIDYEEDEPTNGYHIETHDDDEVFNTTSTRDSEQTKKSCKLKRSESDRALKEDNAKVIFHDSMALRAQNYRTDSRIVFTDKDLEKLDGIYTSRFGKSRPTEPPPEPPKINKQVHTAQISEVEYYEDLDEESGSRKSSSSYEYYEELKEEELVKGGKKVQFEDAAWKKKVSYEEVEVKVQKKVSYEEVDVKVQKKVSYEEVGLKVSYEDPPEASRNKAVEHAAKKKVSYEDLNKPKKKVSVEEPAKKKVVYEDVENYAAVNGDKQMNGEAKKAVHYEDVVDDSMQKHEFSISAKIIAEPPPPSAPPRKKSCNKATKIKTTASERYRENGLRNYEEENNYEDVPLEIILPLDDDRIVVKTVESEESSDEFKPTISRSDASTSEDSDGNNYETHKINIRNYYEDSEFINGYEHKQNYDHQFNNDFIQTPNKTVLRINNLKSTVHKLKIKNEFPETNNINTISISDSSPGKTSIMINGDDCYSTIKVCDEIPLYHSSVVVKDTGSPTEVKKSSSVYITGNFVNTTTVVNSSVKSFDDVGEKEEEAKEFEKVVLREKPALSNVDLLKCLSDPVEAVRRNLVPHVCGKSDPPRRPKRGEQAQLPHIQTLSEEDKVARFIQESFLKLRNNPILDVDDKDVSSEHSSSTQYEIMDQGSECYTDHSNRSSITEEELNARTKFYELLADSSVVEVSESEDHHYESIKMNPDPIYEEIEIPPPLPSNPPPSSLLDDLQLDKEYTTRSIFEGASKYDILSYLVDAKERGIVPEDSYTYNFNNTDVVIEEEAKDNGDLPYNRVSHMSTVSDSSEDSSLVLSCSLTDSENNNNKIQRTIEVERNDSGVGSETSKSSLSKYRVKNDVISTSCEDCESVLENQTENEPLICRKCAKKRTERKEIITEIVETEEKYSRDLQIILEEFYQPMLVAGLLTSDQLSAIFLNVEELLENSQALAERLRDAVEIAVEQGDEDLQTVNIGKLVLEAAPMLHAFETYCVRQGPASLLLASLEKEKELLRIFLRVSQMENTVLRRMNLNSFLMVPVQRVTKYPLLLARLYKVTPTHHDTREQLKEAQHKIELHLNHMNSETKDVPSKLWRRISSIPGRRSSSEMDLVNIKLRKIAVDVLEWNHDEAKFALEGRLLFTQPTDNNWRKGRTIKLTPVNALLVTNGKSTSSTRTDPADESLVFSRQAGVRDAALLLVRDKNGRYSLLREPLYLDRCVIAADPAWQSYFEVQELLGKDTFIFKAEDEDQTKIWYRQLQYYAQGMGAWRKRRNALANIMINGMGLRS